MKHAREDYNKRIQDSANMIPANEPVFLLRAQDKNAAETLRCYAEFIANSLPDDDKSNEMIRKVHEQADAMDAWPVKKDPDV